MSRTHTHWYECCGLLAFYTTYWSQDGWTICSCCRLFQSHGVCTAFPEATSRTTVVPHLNLHISGLLCVLLTGRKPPNGNITSWYQNQCTSDYLSWFWGFWEEETGSIFWGTAIIWTNRNSWWWSFSRTCRTTGGVAKGGVRSHAPPSQVTGPSSGTFRGCGKFVQLLFLFIFILGRLLHLVISCETNGCIVCWSF